jgi:hypothetical protein
MPILAWMDIECELVREHVASAALNKVYPHFVIAANHSMLFSELPSTTLFCWHVD